MNESDGVCKGCGVDDIEHGAVYCYHCINEEEEISKDREHDEKVALGYK